MMSWNLVNIGSGKGLLPHQHQAITWTKPDLFPDSKVHGANMGPTWVMSAPDGPHVSPMNLAIRVANWNTGNNNTKNNDFKNETGPFCAVDSCINQPDIGIEAPPADKSRWCIFNYNSDNNTVMCSPPIQQIEVRNEYVMSSRHYAYYETISSYW